MQPRHRPPHAEQMRVRRTNDLSSEARHRVEGPALQPHRSLVHCCQAPRLGSSPQCLAQPALLGADPPHPGKRVVDAQVLRALE
eukprot:7078092-Alexandrium_andersonii.AAC.1